MGEGSGDWLSRGISAAGELAERVGVVGAALIIVSIGFAFHFPKLATTFREMVADFYAYRIKRDELRQRMASEGERLEAEARQGLRVVTPHKGSET